MLNLTRVIPSSMLALFVLILPVSSIGATHITDLEYKALPPYCMLSKQRLNGDKAAAELGFAQYGAQFRNVQHLCWGIGFLNRYYKNPNRIDEYGEDPKSNLSRAMADLDYMVSNMDKNSAFAAEVSMYRGIIFSIRNEDGKSIAELMKSLSYNPRIANTYNHLANLYERKKQKNEALAIITQGLQHVPEAKSLKSRYIELGGKLPYPEPLIYKPAESTSKDTSNNKTEEKTATTDNRPAAEDNAPTKTIQRSEFKENVNMGAAKPDSAAIPPSEAEKQRADGSKKSWCRFCTD